MAPTKTLKSLKVTLKTASDWPLWLLMIWFTAVGTGVWEYVDPDAATPAPPAPALLDEPEKPREPEVQDFRADAVTFADLTANEMENFLLMTSIWRTDMREYQVKREPYDALTMVIITSVDRSMMPLLYHIKTNRKRLQLLRTLVNYTSANIVEDMHASLAALPD